MLYPIYVHRGDDKHAHGASIPDFPGCFTAADNWNDLPRLVQEAVELHCEGEDMDIPTAGNIEELEATGDYIDGTWVFVDIDISKLDTSSKRVNITLPSNLLEQIDSYANSNGMTRSGFLANSARQALSQR